MSRLIQIPIGSVFGRLTVIVGPMPYDRSMYLCRCECGTEKTIRGVSLRHGINKSCGCLAKGPKPGKYGPVGEWQTPEYRIWIGLKSRCTNMKNCNWSRYGGKGIRFDERWNLYSNFLDDMGRRPSSKHSIDRLDNNGPYSPENCRWATRIEQQNNRPDNRWLEFRGERKTMSQWARFFHVGYTRFQNHLRKTDFNIERTMANIRRIDGHHEELSSGSPIAAKN